MLAICFGYYDLKGNNQFDFYKRLKKLEVLSGKKINKLLLRDKQNLWYHYGVPPLGVDVDETVAADKKDYCRNKTIADYYYRPINGRLCGVYVWRAAWC